MYTLEQYRTLNRSENKCTSAILDAIPSISKMLMSDDYIAVTIEVKEQKG